jgi:hypothetical protein
MDAPVELFDNWFDPIESMVRDRARGLIESEFPSGVRTTCSMSSRNSSQETVRLIISNGVPFADSKFSRFSASKSKLRHSIAPNVRLSPSLNLNYRQKARAE